MILHFKQLYSGTFCHRKFMMPKIHITTKSNEVLSPLEFVRHLPLPQRNITLAQEVTGLLPEAERAFLQSTIICQPHSSTLSNTYTIHHCQRPGISLIRSLATLVQEAWTFLFLNGNRASSILLKRWESGGRKLPN